MSQSRMLLLVSLVALSLAASSAEAQGPFNVTSAPYNAVGNGAGCGGADDTTAVQAAIAAAIAAGGGEVYFPAGTYRLHQTLNITGQSIALRGEGQRASVLLWCIHNNQADGISFVSPIPSPLDPTTHKTLTVRSLSLLRADHNEGAAIRGAWPAYPDPGSVHIGHYNGGAVTAIIEDVHIGSEVGSTNTYWSYGIQLLNATCAKLQSLTITGLSADSGVAGIQLGANPAQSGVGNSMAVYIRDAQITGYVRGIELKDDSEGLHVHDCFMRDVRWGIEMGGGNTTFTAPGTAISRCNITATQRGIWAKEISSIAVTHNTIRRQGNEPFSGIEIDPGLVRATGGFRLIGNLISGPMGGSQQDGIVLDHATFDTIVEGNITTEMVRGIYLKVAAVNGSLIMGNLNRNAGTAIVNGGTGTAAVLNF